MPRPKSLTNFNLRGLSNRYPCHLLALLLGWVGSTEMSLIQLSLVQLNMGYTQSTPQLKHCSAGERALPQALLRRSKGRLIACGRFPCCYDWQNLWCGLKNVV